MTIANVIEKFNGVATPGADWWPDGAMDQREMIVELPTDADYQAFELEVNAFLGNNPIQYIADGPATRTFLYYAV